MIKNKFLCAALSCLLAAGSLAACGQKEPAPAADSVSALTDSSSSDSGSAVSIVTTIFPQYDWVREIVKDSSCFSATVLTFTAISRPRKTL